MGKPKLVWSPIQVRLMNEHKIVPIGHLTRVPMNIDGVYNMEYFEVIETMDDNKPYPTLMGLEHDFDNQAIIELKRREMIFEVRYLKVTSSLDPSKGNRYIEPTKGYDIDKLYNMNAYMDDYDNPTAHGALSWRIISACAS